MGPEHLLGDQMYGEAGEMNKIIKNGENIDLYCLLPTSYLIMGNGHSSFT